MSRRLDLTAIFAASLSLFCLACGGNGAEEGRGTDGASSGSSSGGSTAAGGSSRGGGVAGSGGASSSRASGNGGGPGTGGSSASSLVTASTGRSDSGGNSAVGGTTATGAGGTTGGGGGGTKASGGTGNVGGAGGRSATGGSLPTAGTSTAGGASASAGAVNPGGNTGSGGATSSTGTAAKIDCTDASTTTKDFTKQFADGSLAVTGSSKTYWTMTNWWHKFGGQTVSLNGLSMKLGNAQNASVPASDGNPMGFPSIFIGTYQTKATVGSNLPKKVSDIKSVPTVFQTNASSLDTSNLNASYDVWFTATSAPLSSTMANNPGAGGAYLMVWMFKPKERQPRGGVGGTTGASPNYPATTVDGIPGKWDVWVDKTDPLCISYVASDAIDGLAFDLNKFIQDSVSKQYGITSSMYLSLIFGGFEVWSGGDGLELKQFCAAVN